MLVKFLAVVLVAVAVLIAQNRLGKERENQKYKNKGYFGMENRQCNGLQQISLEEYQHQMQLTTEAEKARLFESDEYKEAVQRKGLNPAAWNWQTREKQLQKKRN